MILLTVIGVVRRAVGEVCSGFYFFVLFYYFFLCGVDLVTVPVGLVVNDMRVFLSSFFFLR